MTIQRVAVFLLWLSISNAVRAADEENAAEVKRVQGSYERYFQNAAGTKFRAVKEVGDGRSLVTTFDDVGNVVESHTSEFKVEKRGPVRVFSFFNLVVTAGPSKGHTQFETNTFIYRVDDESFTDVWGMLEGDGRPPQMTVWRRIKEAK